MGRTTVHFTYHASRITSSSSHPRLRQPTMRPIAKRHILRMFAGAPGNHFGFCDFNLLRFETGSFVRTVTKRLAFRAAASAPPIRARLDLLHDGRSLVNYGFSHNTPL